MWETFFKGIQLVAITESWSAKALEDGKVTITEAAELVTRMCEVLNIPCELDVKAAAVKEE